MPEFGHASPPLAGSGLEQDRDRVFVPSLHEVLHAVNNVHGPQLPWTTSLPEFVKEKCKCRYIFVMHGCSLSYDGYILLTSCVY